MTLSPCRTLQNVIQTQKCVPCREYAKPNRCVFKCFAKVSKPKEEDLKPTGKAFQLLGPATAKDLKPQSVRWLGTTMSPCCRHAVDMLNSCPLHTPLHRQLFSMSVSGLATSQHLYMSRCCDLVKIVSGSGKMSTACLQHLQIVYSISLANPFATKNLML